MPAVAGGVENQLLAFARPGRQNIEGSCDLSDKLQGPVLALVPGDPSSAPVNTRTHKVINRVVATDGRQVFLTIEQTEGDHRELAWFDPLTELS